MNGQQPANDSRGIITEEENGMYKVMFPHDGEEYTLGLFGSLDESHRVCDVLTIKEAVDARRDLLALKLHFELDRYGVDNDTAGEIRSVSFRQVVRDLQVCAVQPLHPIEDTQATSWAAAGPALTSGTVFDGPAASHHHHHHYQGGEAGAAVPTTSAVLRGGLSMLPPRGAARRTQSQATLPFSGMQPSAARAALERAGVANAAAAAGEAAGEAGGGAGGQAAVQQQQQQQQQQRPPHPPPPKFGDDIAIHAATAAAAAEQQGAGQPGGGGGGQQQEGGDAAASPAGVPRPRNDPSRNTDTPRTARKRPVGAEEDEEEEEGGSEGEGETGMQGGGAGGGSTAAGVPRVLLPKQPLPAGGGGGGRGGRRGGPVTKRRRSGIAQPHGPGERPWQSQDVLAFGPDNHPFHGITRDAVGTTRMSAQLVLKFAGDKLSASGKNNKNVRFAHCATPAEAAVCWDLAAIWRALQYGEDPSDLDASEDDFRQLNFDYARYAHLVPTLSTLPKFTDLQLHLRGMRDAGAFGPLATNPTPPAAAAAAAAARQAAAAAAPPPAAPSAAAATAAPAPSAAAAAAAAARPAPSTATAVAGWSGAAAAAAAAGGRYSRRSDFKGVYGNGPYTAQINLRANKMLPEHRKHWSSTRGELSMRVNSCPNPNLGAACYDLLMLWRSHVYGLDPASVTTNLPAHIYDSLIPRLNTRAMPNVSEHITKLRDEGRLDPILKAAEAAGALARPGAAAGTSARKRALPSPAAPAAAGAGAPAAARLASPPAAAAAARAARGAAAPVLAPSASLAELQHQLRGMSQVELQHVAYPRHELGQVQAQQAMYADVHGWLSAVRELSEMEVVAYLAHFVRYRDLRSQLYCQTRTWFQEGKHALIVQHVRSLLPSPADRS